MEKKTKRSTWLWIILCLPMVFMVYFFITLSGGDIDADKVSAVELTLPDGDVLSLTEKEDIEFYVNLYLEADPLAAPLREVGEGEAVEVYIRRTDGNVIFTLYPEVNTNGCFFKNSDGKYYALLSDHAKSLLQRTECAFVYNDGGYALPELMFVTGTGSQPIKPMDYAWQYKDIAGNTVDYDAAEKAGDRQFFSYYSNIGCTFRFSAEPESYTVSFYGEDGNALAVTDPSALIFTTDTKIKAKIEAIWGASGKTLGGSASYEFDLFYDILPKLTQSASSAEIGDVIYVTFRHLSESETITLDTQLVTSPLNVLYKEDYAYVMLPVSAANAAGDYTLKFTVGDISETFTLSVTTPEGSLCRARMDTELYTKYLSPDSIAKYQSLMQVWCAMDGVDMIEAGSAFGKPVDASPLYGYGSYMSVNDVPPYFYLESHDYTLSEGASIKSTQRGTIIYAAEDELMGNMIVIDHGFGVLSHYYNVGEINEGKTVGTTVQKGEIIGTAAVSGMTYKNGEQAEPMLRFGISVNGVFVNPDGFFKDGVDIG